MARWFDDCLVILKAFSAAVGSTRKWDDLRPMDSADYRLRLYRLGRIGTITGKLRPKLASAYRCHPRKSSHTSRHRGVGLICTVVAGPHAARYAVSFGLQARGCRRMSELFEITPGWEPLLRSQGLADMEAILRWDAGERLDKAGLESWRQRWRMRLEDETGRGRVAYLKRFRRPPLRRQVERWRSGHWRVSTAGSEWSNARALADAGIAAVEAVAFGQRMTGVWEQASFILLAEVRGESLERWVPAHVPRIDRDRAPQTRRQRLEALARFVARFHRAGFVHRDLYLCHVFMEEAGDGPVPGGESGCESFRLIDLQRVFRPRWRRWRWVVKDLAALNYSTPLDRVGPAERLRFLCRYVRECGRYGSARQLARRVGARTARMMARLGPPRMPEGV